MKLKYVICVMSVLAVVHSHGNVLYTNAGPISVNETGAGSALSGMTLSRNATSNDTLYFRFTVTNLLSNSTNENYYAAFHLFNGSGEGFGVGNSWSANTYSAFGGAVGVDNIGLISQTTGATQAVGAGETTTIVFKVEYVSGGNDKVTVWLNPDFSKTEAEQAYSTSISTSASFDSIHLREGGGGGGWTFQNMSIADSAESIGFFPVPDTDADGLPDAWEQQIIIASGNTLTLADIKGPNNAPETSDYDNDSSTDAQEFARGTDPTNPDCDSDGLLDGVETNTRIYVSASDTGTDPLDYDTDNDYLDDGVETHTGVFVSSYDTGTNPLLSDSDGDLLIDGDETGTGIFATMIDTGTDPNLADTDGDGINDRLEIRAGSDPFIKTSVLIPGDLALIGSDDFTYADGGIANHNGGAGFDFDNNPFNDGYIGHTTLPSDWDIISGSVNVVNGKLVTQDSAAKREFNGTDEGNVINNDEYIGATNQDSNDRVVYVRADVTRGSGANWSGISVYDFSNERFFFGVPYTPGPSGSREFGIQLSGGTTTYKTSNPMIPEAGKTYTIVGKIDYDLDLISLWVNPDLTKPEAENTPYLTISYAGVAWSTAMRLGSGGLGGSGATTWDSVVAARQWSAIGTYPGVQTNTFSNWISGYPGAASAPGFDQDADHDGVPNGVENVLGSDPSLVSQGLREVSHQAGIFKFRHSKTNNLATDVTMSYQWSTDMLNWHASGQTDIGGTSVTISTTTITDTAAPLNDEIEVTATVSGPSQKLFMRLVAGQP